MVEETSRVPGLSLARTLRGSPRFTRVFPSSRVASTLTSPFSGTMPLLGTVSSMTSLPLVVHRRPAAPLRLANRLLSVPSASTRWREAPGSTLMALEEVEMETPLSTMRASVPSGMRMLVVQEEPMFLFCTTRCLGVSTVTWSAALL